MDGKVTAGDRELHKALLCLPEKNLARHRKDEPVVDGLELIARHRQAAVAAERERCAALVENWNGATRDGDTSLIAAAIRAGKP
mgnify:FL=1